MATADKPSFDPKGISVNEDALQELLPSVKRVGEVVNKPVDTSTIK